MAEIDIPRSRALLAWDALDAAADSRGRRLEWLFTHNVNTKTPPGAAEKKKEKQFSAHFHSAELEGWPPIQCCHPRPLPLLAYPPMREKLMRANIYHQVESPFFILTTLTFSGKTSTV